MANIIDFISMKIRPYNTIILWVFLSIIFLGLSYYAYSEYVKRSTAKSKKYSDVANSEQDNGELNIMMFHVDWCPFCLKSLPEWRQFCNEYNGKTVNGLTVRCNPEGTNCTDDSDEKILAMLEEYDIKSYPTVILFKGNNRYDFDAKITKSNLEQFIKSV